ncbi:hypothetical protein BH20CHL6_BH20CHL6_13620 [soil metagenome]
MCMNCGCMQPDDKHGDEANITMQDLQRAAQANDMDIQQTVDTITRTYEQSGSGSSSATQ